MDEAVKPKEADRPANPEREQRILDAAARLIIHYGYDKTTVGEIAHEAGVSKGAVYLHWDSKDALFKALLLREMQTFTIRWLELIEQDPNGGQLQALYRHSLLAIQERPLLRALVTQDKRVLGDFLRRQDAALYAQRGGISREFVRLMQQAGVVRADIDPVMVAYVLNCIRAGMVFVDDLMPPDQVPPLDEAINGLADFIERAFAPPGGGDSIRGKQAIRSMTAVLQGHWAQGRLM